MFGNNPFGLPATKKKRSSKKTQPITQQTPISDGLTITERNRIERAQAARRYDRIEQAGRYKHTAREATHSLPGNHEGLMGACSAFQAHTSQIGNNDPNRRGWSRIDDPRNVGWWSR